MYFWANSRCRIENSVEKAAVLLHPLNIIGLKIVPRDISKELWAVRSSRVTGGRVIRWERQDSVRPWLAADLYPTLVNQAVINFVMFSKYDGYCLSLRRF